MNKKTSFSILGFLIICAFLFVYIFLFNKSSLYQDAFRTCVSFYEDSLIDNYEYIGNASFEEAFNFVKESNVSDQLINITKEIRRLQK